jgi:SAM-dependent methyltransferase
MIATATATATAAATGTKAVAKAVTDAGAQQEWFASWFDSAHYHRLYAHRDGREAALFIDRLIDRLQPAAGADALDLGCGSGRHATSLASHSLRVTGLDLSAESLALARRRADVAAASGVATARGTAMASGAALAMGSRLRFVRQDMRQPFGSDAFDYVFSLFTSFGYFEDPADHLTVVRNVAASLRAGGRLVLDYLNVSYAERRLTSEETIERDGAIYRLSRWSDSEAIYKRIAIENPRAATPLEYVERVAKLTLEDFRFIFALSGLGVEAIHGDYQLAPFDVESSPRLILMARKTSA